MTVLAPDEALPEEGASLSACRARPRTEVVVVELHKVDCLDEADSGIVGAETRLGAAPGRWDVSWYTCEVMGDRRVVMTAGEGAGPAAWVGL